MKVRAIQTGFYDGVRRRVGDVFEFSGEKLAKWMQPADAKAPITDEQREGPPPGTAEAVKQAHKAKQAGGAKPAKVERSVADLTGDKATGDKATGDQDVI